jgi:predicted nucleic acid-binding protein
VSGSALYLDSSALVKLVVPERESAGLAAALADWSVHVASEVVRVELRRACRRASPGRPEVLERVEEVLAGLHLLRLSRHLLDQAAELPPASLRSLDAIHLASALSLGENLGAMAVYDLALAEAARAAGLTVTAPA